MFSYFPYCSSQKMRHKVVPLEQLRIRKSIFSHMPTKFSYFDHFFLQSSSQDTTTNAWR